MTGIIVAFDREDTLRRVRGMLESSGLRVIAEAKSGSALRRAAAASDGCVIICPAILPDATADELAADFAQRASLLVIDSPANLDFCESSQVVRLSTPLCRGDLLRALSGIRPKGATERPGAEKELIGRAKAVVMERRGLTEPQAHRYLQRISMDCCAKMTDVARRILGEDV